MTTTADASRPVPNVVAGKPGRADGLPRPSDGLTGTPHDPDARGYFGSLGAFQALLVIRKRFHDQDAIFFQHLRHTSELKFHNFVYIFAVKWSEHNNLINSI